MSRRHERDGGGPGAVDRGAGPARRTHPNLSPIAAAGARPARGLQEAVGLFARGAMVSTVFDFFDKEHGHFCVTMSFLRPF